MSGAPKRNAAKYGGRGAGPAGCRPARPRWPARRRLAPAAFLAALALLAALAPAARAGELVQNGGFETGGFGSDWVHGAYRGGNHNPDLADHVVLPDLPHSGGYSALLGFKYTAPVRNTYAFMYQDIAVPSNISRATLNFKVRQQGYDSDYYDPFIVDIRRTNNTVLERIITQSFSEWNHKFKDSGWVSDDGNPPEGFDVSSYAGRTIRLYFEQSNLWDNLYETWTYVDDVSLVYRKFVDLIAGGDGDDRFGNLGTGLGGLDTQSALAGDTLTFMLEVENEGLDGDNYRLTVAAPPGWTVWLESGGPQTFPFTTGLLSPGQTALYPVKAVSPGGAATGSYNITVDAVSVSHANRYDSATLRGNITSGVFATDLVIDGNGYGVIGPGGLGGFATKEAPPDSQLTFDLELFNTGVDPTGFVVSWLAAAGAQTSIWYDGTEYTAPFTTAPVAGGGSLSLILNVSVPAPAAGGDYTSVVTATAVLDTLKKDSVRAVLRLRSPRLDLIIVTSGDNIYDRTFSGLGGSSSAAGEPGITVVFPLVLQNESVLADSFTFSWSPPAGSWSVFLSDGGADHTLPYTTGTVPAYGEGNYQLKIGIPAGASYGNYRSYLHAVSNRDNSISESVTATISVSEPSEIDMIIDGSGLDVYGPVGTGLGGSSVKTASPGDTMVFQVEIQNISGVNSFEIAWNTPLGWTVLFDGRTSPVSAYPAGTYQLTVVVPTDAPGGTVDIIVDGHKTNKPFFMDSVVGRIVVVPPAGVDAVIDGHGEGVYGAPGTGLGGQSTQVTSTPAALNFTLEIQNEGGLPDRFTVSWNSLPGWTAFLAGSASPCLTPLVSSGGSYFATFSVTVPAGELPAGYQYILDIVSVSDSTAGESVTAGVNVVSPPRVDLVIDGHGQGVFGPLGSGQGGSSTRAAGAGAVYNAALQVRNAGSFPDSFYIEWQAPPGWPAGSVVINDGLADRTAPFWTAKVPAGGHLDFTVRVQVPVSIEPGLYPILINSFSSLPPGWPESVKLVTSTGAFLTGRVFNDVDHDAVFSPGDVGLAGVVVRDEAAGLEAVTSGGGTYVIMVAGGTTSLMSERNPSGYVSISPDSIGPFTVSAGDTVRADFADVPAVRLSPGAVLSGLSGGYVDFPHVIEAGTDGTAVVTVQTEAGLVTLLFLDENANGRFDGSDHPLEAGDLDLHPGAGTTELYVLLRVFIPAATPAGLTIPAGLEVVQSVNGTPLSSRATAEDAVLVVGSAGGRLTLQKESDRAAAQPGEMITYTIRLFNAGVDSLQNIVLYDPVSPFVKPLPDAFGPGRDVEWQRPGLPPVYLTFDPLDADECEYRSSESLLQVVFSKNSPFFLQAGEQGVFVYQARVK